MEQQIESEFWQRVWAGAEALVDQHYSNGSDDDDDDDMSLADTYSSEEEEEELSEDEEEVDEDDVMSSNEAMELRGGSGQDDGAAFAEVFGPIADQFAAEATDNNNDDPADDAAATATTTAAADNNNDDDIAEDNDDEFAAIDRETTEVMKERVAVSTRDGYERRNITLLIWLYDNHATHPDIIPFHMLQRMHAAQTTDTSRRTRSGNKSNSRQWR